MQIAWCSEYGVDFLTVDWWPGARKDRDAFLDAFLNAKNIADIRFCVFYETWGLGFDKDFGCTRFDREKSDRLISEFLSIADRCFQHPSYLRLNGRPVVVLYLARTFTGEFQDAVTRLRQALRRQGHDVFLIGDEIFWKVSPAGKKGAPEHPLVESPQIERIRIFDAITSYNMYEGGKTSHVGYASQSRYVEDVAAKYAEYAAAVSNRVYLAPQIIPGYNDRGTRLAADHYAIPRQWEPAAEEGSLLAELFARHAFRFLDPRLNLMFITSWNEWNEDTGIEPLDPAPPTREDRSPDGRAYTQGYSYSGHGFGYLEVVRDKVVAVAGRVTDGSGAGVKGMRVTAGGAKRQAVGTSTDSNGYYRFSRLTLPMGPYTIRAGTSPVQTRDVQVGATDCVCGVDFTASTR
jgi:hypothetical protein